MEQRLTPVLLYGTPACHLCEQAEELLQAHAYKNGGPDFTAVDISESEELFQRYGLRIPVLRRADGAELGWPFDAQQLKRFLADTDKR